MNIDEIIEKKLNNKNKCSVLSAVLNGNTLNVVFKASIDLSEAERNVVVKTLTDEVESFGIEINAKFVKACIDEDIIARFVFKYFNDNFASIPVLSVEYKLDDNLVQIKIASESEFFCDSQNIKNKLLTSLADFFEKEILVDIVYVKSNIDELINAKTNADLEEYYKVKNQPTLIDVGSIVPIFGNIEAKKVKAICEYNAPETDVTLVGKIRFLTERRTKDKEQEGVIVEGKVFYTFSLEDGTKPIKCILFTNTKSEPKLKCLEDDLSVVVSGKIEEYNNALNFSVRYIGKCVFKKIEKEIPKIEEPKSYIAVVPEKYVNADQIDLFGGFQTLNKTLQNQKYVVFDFETTGLDANTEAITELGAVKIENGVITETFSTFVNPNKPIPRNITEITHITDEMVASAPQPEAVMLDFYKFSYGCNIVAHNIDFDYKFLTVNAKKIGLKFDNKQYDTMIMARKYLPHLKRVNLTSVCEELNVSLLGAHRAVNDCLATAKVFIKLTDFVR